MAQNFKLGFIIPTKDRPESLNRLLSSIYSQNLKPSTIIIVDGSDIAVESGILRDPDVEIIYCRELPPSLTKQRNRGIREIPEDLTHIGFLDDDLELLPHSCDEIVKFVLGEDDRLGGVSFNIIPDKKPMPQWLLSFTGIASSKPGGISAGGSVNSNIGVTENRYTKWLCGGATIWRKEVLDSYKFDEWFKNYALWEDVDFSYRVSKDFRLAVVASAPVHHWHINTESPTKARRLGDLEIVDRFYFVSKHRGELSISAALWASINMVIRNAYVGLRERNPYYLNRITGNILAIARCLSGRIERDARLYPQANK